MIIPMLCVTIFVILVVWFLLPRVARLMIHTPTAISIFVCLSMVQLMAVFIRSEERFSRNAETDLVCRLLLEKKNKRSDPDHWYPYSGGCDHAERNDRIDVAVEHTSPYHNSAT